MKLWIQENGRARHVCTPGHTVCQGKVKHQMWSPVPDVVSKVRLTRHHVGHPARLQGWQLFLNEYLDGVDDLSFGQPRQNQFCPFESEW